MEVQPPALALCWEQLLMEGGTLPLRAGNESQPRSFPGNLVARLGLEPRPSVLSCQLLFLRSSSLSTAKELLQSAKRPALRKWAVIPGNKAPVLCPGAD